MTTTQLAIAKCSTSIHLFVCLFVCFLYAKSGRADELGLFGGDELRFYCISKVEIMFAFCGKAGKAPTAF